MDNWPQFNQRYQPNIIAEIPAYRDYLIGVLLLLLVTGALLWAFYQRNKRQRGAGGAVALYSYLALQTILLVGFLYAELVWSSSGSAPYWLVAGSGFLYGLSYLLINLLVYGVLWYAFGVPEKVSQWFLAFFRVWGLVGVTLYLPLLVSITGGGGSIWVISMLLGGTYFFFRMLLIHYSITIFPKLLNFPLHLILYLCTCEIAPLLFLLV